MERQQNIRTAKIRMVADNHYFDGSVIRMNKSGGEVMVGGNIETYSGCEHPKIAGVDACSCKVYQKALRMPQKDWSASAELNRIKTAGITLPKNPIAGRVAARDMLKRASTPGSMLNEIGPMVAALDGTTEGRQRLNKLGSSGHLNMEGMANTLGRRTAAATGSDASWALPKLHDPFEYWRERTWWFNMEDPDEQTRKIRDWARLLYTTHHLVPGLIDIYTRFPLLDIELVHPDKRISDFYNDLFFDGLNYQEFLYDLGREHWTVGEVFAMGSWHDGIGAWEEDEIINPNDVIVAKNRALRTYQYHIKVPEEIKRLIERRDPPQEYAMLMQLYPDVVAWARQDKEIPVSDVIMKQIKFKTNPWSEHGTPILLRAFRMLMLEESLNAAQDAIADRLYSPLILATLGLPDVDQDGPWIPDAAELQSLRDDLSMAINSDFRLMTYHHGLQIQNAFGREAMPRLDQDFMRVQTNVMGVFGIGSDLIQGGQGGTYASGALNRELITQMLSTYQHKIESFIRSRMEPVAERQGHYEMRNVGGQMVPVMETVLMVDEETGAEFVEERPKLAIPEVRFRSMNLRDETVERGFLQQLSASGFPISLGTLAVNIPIDFDDEIHARKEEKIKTVVAEQQFKKELFDRLYTLQLPIPPEYVQEYQAYLAMLEDPSLGAQLAPGAMAGLVTPPAAPNMTGNPAQNSDAATGAQVFPAFNQQARQRPEESYEQRKDQPKPSKKGPKNGPQKNKKTGSVDGDITSTFGEGFNKIEGRVEYGDRMKFAVPFEQKKRKRMKLASGMKLIVDDSYEKFNEEEFKKHLSSIIEASDEPMIKTPTSLDEHSSGEGGMDQPARVQTDPMVEEPTTSGDL